MAYHPLVVEVISNYPSVQFVLNQTSGKHVCLPQHPAGQDQTIWKLKAMARNPLVSTKGVTTAKEGVFYFAGTPILFCKRYKTSLLHVCCYVHGGLLSAKCHPFLRKFAQSEVSIAILPNGMDEAFPRFRPQLWFWKTRPLFLIDSTHLCRCHGTLSFRHLLKYVEILYAVYWLHGGIMIYHDLSCKKEIHHLSRNNLWLGSVLWLLPGLVAFPSGAPRTEGSEGQLTRLPGHWVIETLACTFCRGVCSILRFSRPQRQPDISKYLKRLLWKKCKGHMNNLEQQVFKYLEYCKVDFVRFHLLSQCLVRSCQTVARRLCTVAVQRCTMTSFVHQVCSW